MKHGGFVLIVGCGQLGRTLAVRLIQDGHDVVVVDANKDALNELGPEFRGARVEGDGTDLTVLRSVQIAKAGAVVAVTRQDAVNLMVTQAAKTVFQVPRVLARVNDPRRDLIFQQLGIETVCPAAVGAELFCKAVAGKDPSRIVPP